MSTHIVNTYDPYVGLFDLKTERMIDIVQVVNKIGHACCSQGYYKQPLLVAHSRRRERKLRAELVDKLEQYIKED